MGARRVRPYEGDDPLGFVVSLNLRRRHLSELQRAMITAGLATMRQGERTDLKPSADLQKVAQADAAALLNISPRTVASAAKVRSSGAPELVQAVEVGAVSVSAVADVATLSQEEQRQVVARGEAAKATAYPTRTVIKAAVPLPISDNNLLNGGQS